MDVLSEVRPCRLTVIAVLADGDLRRSAPHADGMWLLRARLNTEEVLTEEIGPLLDGLPVRLEVSVVGQGEPSFEVVYDDDDGDPGLAGVLSDAVARRLSDRLGDAVDAAVALMAPPTRPATPRTCPAARTAPTGCRSRSGTSPRATATAPAGRPEASVSTVVAIDGDAGLLVVDMGDGPVLVAVDAAGWDEQVVRDV